MNGAAGAGKDTFANMLNKFYSTKHISSITPVKAAAKMLGWSGEKTPEYRKFLCEFKKFLNEQGNTIWEYLDKEVKEFRNDNKSQILLIDIREPEEIKKAVNRYHCKTILIKRPKSIESFSNSADDNVENYKYIYTIDNSEDIKHFRESVEGFAKCISYMFCHDYYNIFCPDYYNAKNCKQTKKQDKKVDKVVAVDFDNTIAVTNYPEIIKPILGTVDLIQELHKRGVKIILWTCREGLDLKAALDWCKKYDVTIDYVNENPQSRSELWKNDCRKVGADLYIDDKSFSLWNDRRNTQDIIDALFSE